MPKEFTEDLQKLFLGFLISDKDLYVRIQSLVVPTYFNNKLLYHPIGKSIIPSSKVCKLGNLKTVK